MNKERQLVDKEMTTVDFDGDSLGVVKIKIEALIKAYGSDAFIIYEADMFSESDKEYSRVYVKVPETDEQMKKRISTLEYYEKKRVLVEQREYERLKAIFGDTNGK